MAHQQTSSDKNDGKYINHGVFVWFMLQNIGQYLQEFGWHIPSSWMGIIYHEMNISHSIIE